ncbi:MAG: hypothetical protein PW786_06550 [Arachidicoccus sp.]|nr:hypothetical protein [Arachidicoccus sp.]
MPNKSSDELFQLIKSLEKSEKRNFKLFIKRMSGDDDLKIVQLFDAIDKADEYDEEILLKRNRSIKKQQLSNMKAHLYKQILASLRMLNDDKNVEMQINEWMAYARILYSKGLYMQSLKTIERIKQISAVHQQNTSLLLALELEKKIELLHITRSMRDKAELLSEEVDNTNRHIELQNKLSNLALELYGWYIRLGHVRDEKDITAIELFFKTNLPNVKGLELSFYEKMYLYQAYSWYNFILQNLPMYYRYTQKWVNVFVENPAMQKVEPVLYIKGLHNLLSAHFDTNNFEKFNEVLEQFEAFSETKLAESSANIRVQVFMYLYTAKINKYFLEGRFSEGIKIVPYIEEKLREYKLHLDMHRVLVFYYKIACLYFGSGDNEKAIDYLHKIIHQKSDLRTDLQCYARLLHLIAHYELGNYDLLEYLLKSVYRFMAKMKNLSIVEEAIFSFLKKSFKLSPAKVLAEFKKLKTELEKLENNPLETRSFLYLDIKGWLESKIRNVPVQEVIRERFLQTKH